MDALTEHDPSSAPPPETALRDHPVNDRALGDHALDDRAVRDEALRELEGRVQSLEVAVTRLGDTQALEERVVARVAERLPQVKAGPERDVAAMDVGVMEERIAARLSERLPPSPPDSRAAEANPPNVDVGLLASWGGAWSSWLLVDMVREAKLLATMILDRRYQMAWTTRIVALVLFPAILTTHWWLPLAWLPFAGGLFVNLVNLVLAFALLKALSRETRRYQERLRH